MTDSSQPTPGDSAPVDPSTGDLPASDGPAPTTTAEIVLEPDLTLIDHAPAVSGSPPSPPPAPPSRLPFSDTPPVIPPETRTPTPIRPAWVIAAVAVGVLADIALRRVPWNNVAGTLLIIGLAAGLATSGFVRSRTSKVMVGGAVFFSMFLMIRTEPRLTAFNIIASIVLLGLAAVHGQGRPFLDLRPLRLMADTGIVAMESIVGLVEVPAEVAARARVLKERAENSGSTWMSEVGRGVLIAGPLVLVLGLLLASADVVFQSFFSGFGGLNIGAFLGHIILAMIGAYTVMVLLRVAAQQGATDPIQRALSLGRVEVGVILVSVNVLFGAFAVAQLMTILGGAAEALERAGLDSKQFARQGFFQLLWVAGITLVMLMALQAATSENQQARKINRPLSLITVALTLVIVTVAFTRIGFYIDDNGMTPLRFYSALFSLWVGLAFVITSLRIWGFRPRQAWLLPVILLTAFGTLAALNVANPERIIAMDNLERDHDPLFFHVQEGQFSGDGQAVLAEEMDRLSPERGRKVTEQLCDQYSRYDYNASWLNFNLGKWRAENTVPDLCGE